jgi:hypothetical protein
MEISPLGKREKPIKGACMQRKTRGIKAIKTDRIAKYNAHTMEQPQNKAKIKHAASRQTIKALKSRAKAE